MNDIDTIMDMLNWHQPEDIQAEGRKIAQNVKCISVFVMPINGKCVWDNCAMILSEKNDDELKHIVPNLLFWFIDINWPGSLCIWDRLLKFKDKEWMSLFLNSRMKMALNYNEIWLHTLQEFKQEYDVLNP